MDCFRGKDDPTRRMISNIILEPTACRLYCTAVCGTLINLKWETANLKSSLWLKVISNLLCSVKLDICMYENLQPCWGHSNQEKCAISAQVFGIGFPYKTGSVVLLEILFHQLGIFLTAWIDQGGAIAQDTVRKNSHIKCFTNGSDKQVCCSCIECPISYSQLVILSVSKINMTQNVLVPI